MKDRVRVLEYMRMRRQIEYVRFMVTRSRDLPPIQAPAGLVVPNFHRYALRH